MINDHQINPYSIPSLISAILTLFSGLIVFYNNRKSYSNQTFFKLCLATTTWLSFYSINYMIEGSNPKLVYEFTKFAYCGVCFISVFYFEHTIAILNLKQYRFWITLNYVWGIVVSLLIYKTDLIICGLYKFFWGLYPKAGALHPFFLGYFCFIVTFSLLLHMLLSNITSWILISLLRKAPCILFL